LTRIYEKTEIGGHVAVYEIEGKYDIAKMKEYLQNAREKLNLTEDGFTEKWAVFEQVLQEFNDLVDRQEFTIFTPEQMVSIFSGVGFTPLASQGKNVYFFRK